MNQIMIPGEPRPLGKLRKRKHADEIRILSDQDCSENESNLSTPTSKKVKTIHKVEPTKDLELDIENIPELVIIKIFGLLQLKDLKNCRRVCWKWNHFALRAIQKFDYVVSFKQNTMENFSKAMKKTCQFPYFRFYVWNTFRPQNRLESFWVYAKYLRIEVEANRPSTRSLIDFSNLLKILSVTPNLEELVLDNIDFAEIPESKKNTSDWLLGLQLPKLTRITFNNVFKNTLHQLEDRSDNSPVRKALEKFFRAAPNLVSLKINTDINQPGLRSHFLNIALKIAQKFTTLEMKNVVINIPKEPVHLPTVF